MVMQQVLNHKKFVDWAKRWKALNEKISDHKLEELLAGKEPGEDTPEKKRPRRSSGKSGARSRS